MSRTALELEVKGKIISKNLTMMVTQASQNYSKQKAEVWAHKLI
jgi:hypothetical protein